MGYSGTVCGIINFFCRGLKLSQQLFYFQKSILLKKSSKKSKIENESQGVTQQIKLGIVVSCIWKY